MRRSNRAKRILRGLLAAVGAACIALALSADLIGVGQPGSFGRGQLLVALAGAGMLFLLLLGPQFINFYKMVAIILLNTVVLLAGLELTAILVSRAGWFPSKWEVQLSRQRSAPYYGTREWADQFWLESRGVERFRYEPYTVWRHRPFQGETIRIGPQGIRQTPGSVDPAEALQVFAFGGSTLWGWGSPDWETIPAFLQSGLRSNLDEPAVVVNFGEDGYVSTQNLIELVRQLQAGKVPDVTIFYDGVNDVLAAYESGRPGAHVTLSKIAGQFEKRDHPLVTWLLQSRLVAVTRGLFDLSVYPAASLIKDQEIAVLAKSVSEVYLHNYRVLGALAKEYDFRLYCFWQPHLAVGKKLLTEAEQAALDRLDKSLQDLFLQTYQNIKSAEPEYSRLWYLADVFSGEEDQIWIDEWGHVTPRGNRLVAEQMLAIVLSDVGS